MQTVSSFVQPHTSIFQQCLLAKDPQAHVATLPESPLKSILNFLLEPHTQKFRQELINKYKVSGELLNTLDQWKTQSKISNAKSSTEIQYLIDEYLKKNGNHFHYSKPSQFLSCAQQIQSQQPSYPSQLHEIKSLAQWAEQQLNQNQMSIFGFSEKAINSLPHDRLLKLGIQCKEFIFQIQTLRNYPDKFVVQFAKSYYDEQIQNNSSFQIPHYFYKSFTKSQFLLLKDSISSLLNNNQYLRSWFVLQFEEELQNFTKPDLTISEKDELRNLFLKILKSVEELRTPKVKPIRVNTLRQLIALDIWREETGKECFQFFKQYLENSRNSTLFETATLKQMKTQMNRNNDGVDDTLGRISIIQKSEDDLIKNYVEVLLKRQDSDSYVKQLEYYFDKKFILSTLAYIRLGQGESLEKFLPHLTTEELKVFKQKRQITIVPQNKTKWYANEGVTLKLRVKNVSQIHVQIYKLDLEKHFLQNNPQIDQTQSFSYLQPNHEYYYSTQAQSPYKIQTFDVKIQGIPQGRGIWVVELEGQGISSRAFIRKGGLANINTNNSNGTQLRFYDQNGAQLEKYSLWIEGKKHHVESLFTIPFGETKKNLDVIVLKDGYAERFNMEIPKEAYNLNVSYIYNTESFLVGSIAKVLLHPTLTLYFDSSIDVSFKLLEKVKILVFLTNNLGIRSTIDFDNVQFKATQDYVLQFPIQSYISSIQITVQGKIKKYNSKEETLTNSHLIDIALGENNLNFNDLYLRDNSQGYKLLVLGKNGEPAPYNQVIVRYQVDGINTMQSQHLQTTKDGAISLGALAGVQNLTAQVSLKSGVISRNWVFSKNQELDLPNNSIFRQGEEIVFPINPEQKLQLWRINQSNVYMQNRNAQIHQQQFQVTIKGLAKGRYVLIYSGFGHQLYFSVFKSRSWGIESQFADEKSENIIEVSSFQNKHFSLGSATFLKHENNTIVQIPVHGTYDFSQDQHFRAHLLVSNFVFPNFIEQFDTSKTKSNFLNRVLPFKVKQSQFFNNKKLSQESSYTINRKNEKKYIGNNFEKPKLFLKRIEIRETTQKDQVLEKDKEYQYGGKKNDYRSMAGCSARSRQANHFNLPVAIMNPNLITTQNNFLTLPGTIIANQKGNVLEFVVPDGYSHFQCIAFNKKSSLIKKFNLPTEQLKTKNLLHSGIQNKNQNTAKTMSREVYKATKGQSIKVGRDSIWSVVGLSNIVGFAKIKGAILEDWVSNWSTYNQEQKLAVYDEKMCHELNSYIKYHDKQFFTKIVEPLIRNKAIKTFVDLALMNDKDALKWTKLSLFGDLNEFQKVLLVQQLMLAGKKDDAQMIANSMDNINKSNPVSFDNFKKQFDTVITAKLTQQPQQPQPTQARYAPPPPHPSFPITTTSSINVCRPTIIEQQRIPFECQMRLCADEDMRFVQQRKRIVNDFKEIQKTKQFSETTYEGLKDPTETRRLVKQSPFWASVAQHMTNKSGIFLSESFMYLNSKIQFTLAACFIPNKKLLEYGLKNDNENVIIEACSNFLVFVRELKCLPYQKKFGVLLNQRFFNPDDQFYYEQDGTRIEKEADQFVVRTPYCVQTLITNTSGTKLQLQILIDIPEGSIPLKSHQNTNIQNIILEPYSTLSFERFFYFPRVGCYSLYPANACRGGLVIGKCEELKKLEVVEKETRKDLNTFQNVLRSGNKQTILNFLETKNIFDQKIFQPSHILWMLKEKHFFLKAVQILRTRKCYLDRVWHFGYYHNDLLTISEYEQKQQNPKNIFSHLPIFEYFPYFSTRAHKFLNENKSTIRNDQFKRTYLTFLLVGLLNEPSSSRSRATFIYYLLLQDRIDDAHSVYSLLTETDKQQHLIQFDYIECFIDMYKGYPSFSRARKISQNYLNYPVKAWQVLFQQISTTLKDYDSQQVTEQVRTVEFNTTVINEGSQLKLSIPANTLAEVYIYGLNLELYFSEFPFIDFNSLTPKTVPNSIKMFSVSNQSREENIQRGTELSDCFVQIYSSTDGATKKKISSILWSNPQIKVNIKEKNGTAQVFYENKKQAGCYVKVYQKKNGVDSFYRDGYTDITGTFKYALTDLEGISQFVILFMTDNGGVVQRVKPPSQQGYFA